MKKYVLLAVSALLTLLVFYMSLQPGAASDAMSSPITLAIERILTGIFPNYDVEFVLLHVIVRKFAHMAEYFALGVSYMLTARAWENNLWPVYLAGVMVAFLDEWLQGFVPNRFPYLLDVLVFDIPGFELGALAVLFVAEAIRKKRLRQNNVS